jgi:hypothetical protein
MPFWFRSLNNVIRAGRAVGLKGKLDRDDLIRSARKVTGLTDLGPDFDEGPLDRLLLAMNEEARLHPIGRLITRQRMISLISIRLRAEHYFKIYPEILQQELYPAWIIVGLQRTGTTKLQRMLAQDPDHRVIPSWEVINPVPLISPQSPVGSRQSAVTDHESQVTSHGSRLTVNGSRLPYPDPKRLKVARLSVNAVKMMAPHFFAIHPIEVEEPEEDILMLDVSFLSTTPEAMMHVPSYSAWLEQTDQSAAYAYAVKLLKFLQWIKPAKRWVLKTPHHLEFPDLIEKHFNEVHFLWPHRKIYESVPSFMSMVTYNRMIFSDTADPTQVGSHWLRKTGYMLQKALEYRMKPGNDRKFTDIFYPNFIKDSMTELDRVYSLHGGIPEGLAERFERHEKEHPHRKYGTHSYSLADFGLTEADIDKHTSHYRDFLSTKYNDRIETKKV